MMGALRFEIYRSPAASLLSLLRGGGDWRWRFCRSDGSVVARSEGYPSHAACLLAIDALQRRAPVATIVGIEAPADEGRAAPFPIASTN